MSRSIARLFEALGNFVSLRKGSVTVLFLWLVIGVAAIRRLGQPNSTSRILDNAAGQLGYILRPPVALAVMIISPIAFILIPRT
jgi:hypothetical protein